MASARKKPSSRNQSTFGKPKAGLKAERHYVICIRNDDYAASLELKKLYEVLDDEFGANHQMIRVIDESGEDYLYPGSYFVRVDLPASVERTLRKIA
ncbi:MAG TPA: hypothetical protein VGJ81_10270 [Thermoanaerobaculia bacterium]|jgi:hypothetical protein